MNLQNQTIAVPNEQSNKSLKARTGRGY